ncbi:MAG: hypothetical protein V4550_17740 [Gemmatimonadota bacterium]
MRARVTRYDEASEGPTLFAGLHSIAIRQVPARFYLLMQVAAPAGLQLWAWGWHRSALALAVVSTFGLWALFEKKLDETSETGMGSPPPGLAFRIGHKAVGLLASLLTLALFGERVIRLMSIFFKCPGCAG